MAVPDFQTLMLPLLELAGDGQQHTSAEAVESLAQRFQLSTDDRGQLLQNGQPRFNNRVGWATTCLKKAGLVQAVGRGRFELTDRGRDLLAIPVPDIERRFFRSWENLMGMYASLVDRTVCLLVTSQLRHSPSVVEGALLMDGA